MTERKIKISGRSRTEPVVVRIVPGGLVMARSENQQEANQDEKARGETRGKGERRRTRTKSQTRKDGKSRSKKKVCLLFAAGVVFSALLVFAGLKIYQWHRDNLEAQEQQEQTADDSAGREVSAEGELVNPPDDKQDDYWYFIGLPFYEVDFDELKARNPDTVAFIHMNNNNVNYPVVQTTDNDYYLHHAFDGSANDAGWVFMDYRSSLSSPTQNTIIYGHGRYNGTVFGSLRDALTPQWQSDRNNYAIWLSTPTENLMYQIFSIYEIEAEGYYLRQNFTPSEWRTWIETMAGRNVASLSASASETDQVLTLSTCKDDFGTRIAIHAKLIKRQAR